VPLAICTTLKCVGRWNSVVYFNVAIFEQFIEYFITFANIKCKLNLFLSFFFEPTAMRKKPKT
jgi:hypothetical protein